MYPNLGNVVTFTSPLNPGTPVSTNASGAYSAALLADSNFTARIYAYTPGNATSLIFQNMPVGTLSQSQTYNLTMPIAQLTVSVRDASGSPVTGGQLQYDSSSANPLPGLPGTTARHHRQRHRHWTPTATSPPRSPTASPSTTPGSSSTTASSSRSRRQP